MNSNLHNHHGKAYTNSTMAYFGLFYVHFQKYDVRETY